MKCNASVDIPAPFQLSAFVFLREHWIVRSQRKNILQIPYGSTESGNRICWICVSLGSSCVSENNLSDSVYSL